MTFLMNVNVWLPLAFGAFGGLLCALQNSKEQTIEMPRFQRYARGLVFKPGFLAIFKEIFIGSGAGFVAANSVMVAGTTEIMAYVFAMLAGFSGGKYLVKRSEQFVDSTLEKDIEEASNRIDEIIKQNKKGGS